MTEIRDTLKSRGANYGDYKGNVALRAAIMELIESAHSEENNGEFLSQVHFGYIWDIVNKLVRITTTPTHVDSWVDIAGYATLVRDQLIKERPEDATK